MALLSLGHFFLCKIVVNCFVKPKKKNNRVAIIMGSQSDHSIMIECEKILKILKVKFQVLIVSAHRTPKRMFNLLITQQKMDLQ